MGYRYFLITLISGLAASYFLITKTTIGTNPIAVFMLAMWVIILVGVYAAGKKYGKKTYNKNKEQSNKSL